MAIQPTNSAFRKSPEFAKPNAVSETPIEKVAKNTLNSIQDPLLKLHKKMELNFVKALKDHGKDEATITRLCRELQNREVKAPLKFSFNSFEAQGERPRMEDKTMVVQKEDSNGKMQILACLCDGHDSSIIPEMVTQAFKNKFFDELELVKGNVPKAFQNIVDKCHGEVLEKQLDGGTTVVVCFIKDNRLYVGTLGDSEALLAIKRNEVDANGVVKERVEIAECSRVINWSTPKQAKKLEDELGIIGLAEYLQKLGGKRARIPFIHFGLNVEGSVGDIKYLPLMSHKMRTSEVVLNPNEECEYEVIADSDGIVDYTTPEGVAKVIAKYWGSSVLAEELCKYALKNGQSQDNVSAIAIHIQRA